MQLMSKTELGHDITQKPLYEVFWEKNFRILREKQIAFQKDCLLSDYNIYVT